MAYGNRCVRCGYEEEEHNPNLVNEPGDGHEWFEQPREGFALSILDCMETEHPLEYQERTKEYELRLEQDEYHIGYMSPNPEVEYSRYQEEISRWTIPKGSIIVDGRVYETE